MTDFYNSGTPTANGNTPLARSIAGDITATIRRQAAGAARSHQVHIGPSELGLSCDRRVVGKLVAPQLNLPTQSENSDPWPSIVGTAIHAWMADAFAADDPERWLTEKPVVPHPEHPGTLDLYDAKTRSCLDWKCLGASTAATLRAKGPHRQYKAQLALYALGLIRMGLPVDNIGIVLLPRTGSSLDGVYVWLHPMDQSIADLLREVFEDTKRRKQYAVEVLAHTRTLNQVPAEPGECRFCPLYRMCPDAV
jgi:hypothetical protein